MKLLKTNKKSPPLNRDERLTRGTTLLAGKQASHFRYIHTLAFNNGGNPARPTQVQPAACKCISSASSAMFHLAIAL